MKTSAATSAEDSVMRIVEIVRMSVEHETMKIARTVRTSVEFLGILLAVGCARDNVSLGDGAYANAGANGQSTSSPSPEAGRGVGLTGGQFGEGFADANGLLGTAGFNAGGGGNAEAWSGAGENAGHGSAVEGTDPVSERGGAAGGVPAMGGSPGTGGWAAAAGGDSGARGGDSGHSSASGGAAGNVVAPGAGGAASVGPDGSVALGGSSGEDSRCAEEGTYRTMTDGGPGRLPEGGCLGSNVACNIGTWDVCSEGCCSGYFKLINKSFACCK